MMEGARYSQMKTPGVAGHAFSLLEHGQWRSTALGMELGASIVLIAVVAALTGSAVKSTVRVNRRTSRHAEITAFADIQRVVATLNRKDVLARSEREQVAADIRNAAIAVPHLVWKARQYGGDIPTRLEAAARQLHENRRSVMFATPDDIVRVHTECLVAMVAMCLINYADLPGAQIGCTPETPPAMRSRATMLRQVAVALLPAGAFGLEVHLGLHHSQPFGSTVALGFLAMTVASLAALIHPNFKAYLGSVLEPLVALVGSLRGGAPSDTGKAAEPTAENREGAASS